jgi:hypothetical protein
MKEIRIKIGTCNKKRKVFRRGTVLARLLACRKYYADWRYCKRSTITVECTEINAFDIDFFSPNFKPFFLTNACALLYIIPIILEPFAQLTQNIHLD